MGWRPTPRNAEKQMVKKHNANTLFRGHSMINGLVKDVLASLQSEIWTEDDEGLKIEIFSEIVVPNKCWYCGVGEMKDMDHFIPTNGRLFKPPMFGLEHEGNIIPSCKVCNANKSNKHPIEWLKKGRITKGKEFSFPKCRVEAFELFFDLFKDKLIADKELTSIITDQVIPKCESSTQELAGFLNWIKL